MKYSIGQKLVHKSHGVGIITGIETREFIAGTPRSFYILTIQDNGAPKKVFVPVDSAEKLRKPVDAKTATLIRGMIRNGIPDESIDHQTWNRRYRDLMERIHTGDAIEVAKVVVVLNKLKAEKDLSFGERKLLEQATTLIQAEIGEL